MYLKAQRELGVDSDTFNVYTEGLRLIGYTKSPQNWVETFSPVHDWEIKFSTSLIEWLRTQGCM